VVASSPTAAQPAIIPVLANQLDQLRSMSVVVADTGDIESIRKFKPQDCTTNPSLILKASLQPEYAYLVDEAVSWARQQGGQSDAVVSAACERIAVNFGEQLLKIVPGRVSTEVDADLSFDVAKSLAQARAIIADYERRGIGRERVLIKLAATWEGIKTAEILEKEQINCNLTLIFSFAQAVACAEAGAFLISPFVGRVLDWYVKSTGQTYTAETNPGVLSVRKIYAHYKTHGFKTIVMGASFRSIGEVAALAGCDRLTIGTQHLEQLTQETSPLHLQLDASHHKPAPRPAPLSEPAFRFAHNEDAMATEKLAEGIRQFAADLNKMRAMVRARL
jgi:transaldolase